MGTTDHGPDIEVAALYASMSAVRATLPMLEPPHEATDAVASAIFDIIDQLEHDHGRGGVAALVTALAFDLAQAAESRARAAGHDVTTELDREEAAMLRLEHRARGSE